MALKETKLDITDRVVGKLKNGEIELYLGGDKIGRILLNGSANFELDSRFSIEQQHIFQEVPMTVEPEPRYTDCDEGGWC